MEALKIGFIPAHRGVMDQNFSTDRRGRLLHVFSALKDVDIVAPDDTLTTGGLVSNEHEALKVIEFFSQSRLDGVIIGVLGYGDEKSVLAIVEEFQNLPIFLIAMKEPVPDGGFFEGASVGGMLPISYGLHKRNIRFTFGGVFDPEDGDLKGEFDGFTRVCLAIKKFKKARIGMIGLRPHDFEVCMINEGLLLERYLQKVIPFNLIDLKYELEKIQDTDERVRAVVNNIISTFQAQCNKNDLLKIAKLEVLMLQYAREYRLDAFTIQCWTAIQDYIGLTPCLTNGRVTHLGFPVACEGDVLGALSMLLQRELTLEKGTPWIADVLMLHPQEENLFMAWHCGNASVQLVAEGQTPRLDSHCSFDPTFKGGIATAEFMFQPGDVTVNRLVEHHGVYKMLNFEGSMVKKDDHMRGAWAWVAVKDREKMLRTLVEEGFVHHVSIVHEKLSKHIKEACKYLDMKYVEA